MTEPRRPNAADPSDAIPPGAIVRPGGPGYKPVAMWTASDWWAERQARRARKQAAREGRPESGEGDV
jgi:hypothetical protein